MLWERLAGLIDRLGDRAMVAFDGPDAAGKTFAADAVAARMQRPNVRASIDGFHKPKAVRLRHGISAPASYYNDGFDYAALQTRLLLPFRTGADSVEVAIYDYRREAADVVVRRGLPAGTVLLCDGVFLLRGELRDLWTLRIYLDVAPETTLRRAVLRDAELFGSDAAVVDRYRARYLPAQDLYVAEANPRANAHIVIDNNDFADPRAVRWDPPS
ncbi:MAG TPA: hypothetical protein VFH54_03400 [Mycobacteriales bacterium]|nr:hypothetical protein [Mycobacteriales bacterium]